MNINDNKSKGKAGLAIAIGYYGNEGYTISLPLNDTQDYDLIIDNGESLKKVQVRCTGHINKYGRYEVSVKSSGGTKGCTYSHVKDTDIDILFVVCTNGWMFEIPKNVITQSSSITLYNEKSKYSNSEDYSKYMVHLKFNNND